MLCITKSVIVSNKWCCSYWTGGNRDPWVILQPGIKAQNALGGDCYLALIFFGGREEGKSVWSQTEVKWGSSRIGNRLQEFWLLKTWTVARRAITKRKYISCEHRVSTLANSCSLAAGSDLLMLSWQTRFVQHSSLKTVTLMLSLALFAVLDGLCYVAFPDLWWQIGVWDVSLRSKCLLTHVMQQGRS